MLDTKEEGDIIVVDATGAFGLDDISVTFAAIKSRGSDGRGFRILVRDPGSSFEPDQNGVRSFLAIWNKIFGHMRVRIALVVARDLHYGLGRQAEVFAEHWPLEFAVFRDENEATQWLRRSDAAAQQGVEPDVE